MWQQFGNGDNYSYRYDWKPGPGKVVVTLPDQTTREVDVAGAVPEFVKNYHRWAVRRRDFRATAAKSRFRLSLPWQIAVGDWITVLPATEVIE